MTICSERLHQPDITVSSLVDLLQQRAAFAPERVAYRFLGDGETGESRITYEELNLRARSIAASLQEMGARGERVLLLYPAGLAYVEAFFGCLYAGVIAVPAYPPRLNRNAQRLQAIATDAEATIALTNAALLTKIESIATQIPELARLRWLATDIIDDSQAGTYREPELSAESLAYLQYTSGSTATPKGVMVTHGNVLHNSASIHRGFCAYTRQSRANMASTFSRHGSDRRHYPAALWRILRHHSCRLPLFSNNHCAGWKPSRVFKSRTRVVQTSLTTCACAA